MISFTFRSKDVLWPLGLLILTIIGTAWNQLHGQPISAIPLLGLVIAFAGLLVDGYYRARSNIREIQYRAKVETQPLLELKAQLVRELNGGRFKVEALKTEAKNLESQRVTAAQLASLDKAAVQSLLVALSLPKRHSPWGERVFGFVSGVVASLVASVIYELLKR